MTKLYILNTENIVIDTNESNVSQNKKASFLGYQLLKTVLSVDFNVKEEDIILKKDEHGKPYLQPKNGIHFNISHSKNYVAVAVSQSEVGVDIEFISSPNLKIADRFFIESEQQYILSETGDSHKRFYEIWTKKEAYVKRSGQGLSAGLKSFDVTDDSISSLFHTFEIEGLMITVCTDDTDLKVINSKKIEEMFKRYCTNKKYMVK